MSKDNLHCHYSDLPSPMSYNKPKKVNDMTKKEAQTELINLLMSQVEQLSIMSKIELGDDVIEEIQRLQRIINKPKIKPLTEGGELLNYKKNPPSNKTTPPPPPPLPPRDRLIREGQVPKKPKSYNV